MWDFAKQPRLRAVLDARYAKLRDTAGCVIYDMRTRIDVDETP
jgi:hypothetical protein